MADREPPPGTGAPDVSVILPTRNRVGSLERALRSALSQEAVALEVLVVDDASTDDTPRLLADAAEQDARVRVLRQPQRAGAAVARNRGAAEAAAPLLAFLDDDDEWLPGKLRRQLDAAGSGVDVVSCGFAEVAADGTAVVAGRVDLGLAPARATLVRGNVLGLSATLVRSATFRQVGGFDERLPRLQDWDLWIRLAGVATFTHVPDTLAVIHRSGQSISADPEALARAAEIMAGKHAPDPARRGRDGAAAGLDAAEYADLLLSLARLLVRDGVDRSGRRLAARALAAWPPSLHRVAAGAVMSLAPGVYRRATAATATRTRAASGPVSSGGRSA